LKDKQDSATKAIKDLQQQIEDLLKKIKENSS
jgi:ABC-type Fe3+-hydroxamate transport system substrate-binding protein